MDLTGYGYKRKTASPAAPAGSDQAQQPAVLSAELTADALRLVDALTRACPLRELASRFPRVLNRIASLWNQPAALERHFEELLLDSRGQRQGFPAEVLTELSRLRSLSASRLRPSRVDPWQEVHLR
jgi:hypothetical protein